jgi:hypothetical protein
MIAIDELNDISFLNDLTYNESEIFIMLNIWLWTYWKELFKKCSIESKLKYDRIECIDNELNNKIEYKNIDINSL